MSYSLISDDPATLERSIGGSLEAVGEDEIVGWVYDELLPDSPIRIDIFVDGKLVIEGVLANLFRQDLQQAGQGNGKHCFVVPTPPILHDGKSHEVSVRCWREATDLADSPIGVQFAAKEQTTSADLVEPVL